MEKNLVIMIIFVLAFIALIILLIKKNHKDKKDLFKNMPGDYPGPKEVKSKFDTQDKQICRYKAKTFTFSKCKIMKALVYHGPGKKNQNL